MQTFFQLSFYLSGSSYPLSRTWINKMWPSAWFRWCRTHCDHSLFGRHGAHASDVTWLVCLAVCCGTHPYETCHLSCACYYHFPCHASAAQANGFFRWDDVLSSWPQFGIHSVFWYPAICLSLSCLPCYPTSRLSLHLSFSFISPIHEPSLKLQRVRFFQIERGLKTIPSLK